MATAISAQQLAVTFPGRGRRPAVTALHPLDLGVRAGSIVGVLGPNGSGKTTLLRVLAGLLRPTAGTARVLDLEPDAAELRRRVGFQPEGPLPLAVLSAPELLAFVGAELGLPNDESDRRARALLERLELTHAARRRVRTFSTGMQKRLALAAALLGDPEVLLLDEPTSGLDPFGSAAVMTILRERAAAGTAVLMASHHLLEVEELCDEVLLLHQGRVHARGRLDELLADEGHAIVVRGGDDQLAQRLADEARRLGAQHVEVRRPKRHLFALFRGLGRDSAEGGEPRP